MAARAYQLAITGVAQPLSNALPADTAGSGGQPPTVSVVRGGRRDEAFLQLIITADTQCFIGADNTVTTTTYGYTVFPMAAATWQVLEIGPFVSGPIKLSDLWVIGTTGVLHILGIPF